MKVTRLTASVYRIPTEGPEADASAQWDATTVVLVEAEGADGQRGLGYTYTAAAAAQVVRDLLVGAVCGRSLEDVQPVGKAMLAAVAEVDPPELAACAVSAVDIALWDLRARAVEQPLFQLLGAQRPAAPVYGGGGFLNYSTAQLIEQLGGWVARGIARVQMKVGRGVGAGADQDLARVQAVRAALGPKVELYVDADGAFKPAGAIALAGRLAAQGVTCFEEPVPSAALEQLAQVRREGGVRVAAGEYGFDPLYFRNLMAAGAVDIVQPAVTRCLGVTGWLAAVQLADSFELGVWAPGAPALHAHMACAAPTPVQVEYFHDHARVEGLLFDGVVDPVDGELRPDPGRPGLGLELKRASAERWRVG